MAELKIIERDELKLLKLVKAPVLMWCADVSIKTLHVFYKGGAIDDPTGVLAVNDVIERLELNGVVMHGVMVRQRIADLAIFCCASASSVNRIIVMDVPAPKPTFLGRWLDNIRAVF